VYPRAAGGGIGKGGTQSYAYLRRTADRCRQRVDCYCLRRLAACR
jgi:hypothetical protein